MSDGVERTEGGAIAKRSGTVLRKGIGNDICKQRCTRWSFGFRKRERRGKRGLDR